MELTICLNESRSICLAALGSLLLHVMLFGIAVGSSTERTMAMALNVIKGDVAQPNGEAGTISVLLMGEYVETPVPSPNTYSDTDNVDGRLVSTIVADVPESIPESTSHNTPPDSADSTPTEPSGAAQAIRQSITLDDYSAQIMGRIERAWERPIARLEGAFHCEAKISQTSQGEVRDITLTHCDGDPDWRQSITRAIRYASPLPAPPSETAFRPVVTLNFQAEPLSGALLARLQSVSEDVGPAEHRDNPAKPRGSDVTIGGPRAVDHHTQ